MPPVSKLTPGTKVLCRFFNKPDAKFYGEPFPAVIIDHQPDYTPPRDFMIRKTNGLVISVWHKEIKEII